jgi:hypothetical protein
MAGTPVDMMVDTSAPVNIIDEVTHGNLAKQPVLEACDTHFYGYTSNVPLPVRGQFLQRVEYEGN